MNVEKSFRYRVMFKIVFCHKHWTLTRIKMTSSRSSLVPQIAIFLSALQYVWGLSYPFSQEELGRECVDMFPESLGHHSQLSEAPYSIKTSDTFYEGVSHEKVTIRATGSHKINAFFIQARVADCSANDRDLPIGRFEKEQGYDDVELVHCSGRHNSAAVSRKWFMNKEEVVMKWFKPENETRKLYFRATVVASKELFWMENFSDNIRSLTDTEAGQICPVRLLGNNAIVPSISFLFLIATMATKYVLF